jgi:hypothetical protein
MAKYDKRDPDPQVIKLTRAGHYLWFQLKNANLAPTHRQQMPILEALEIIWAAKRTLKAELAAKRTAEFGARRPFSKIPVLVE